MKALKGFFFAIMACFGMLSHTAFAQQSCSSHDGDGLESFSVLSSAGYTCLRLALTEGSTLTVSTPDSFSFFSLYGGDGAFQDLRESGTSWSYTNTPAVRDVAIQFAWDPSMVGQSFDYSVNVTAAVAPVPEPSTYALMLAGLGAIALLAKRRKVASFGPAATAAA